MKKLLLLCLFVLIHLWANAQATDLVVDCQTPGWLSSKINYGDQLTVKNLKVTGYINNTDLLFIGSLISSRSLNGVLDLSECNIVGKTADKDNVLGGLGASGSLDTYYIPKSATEVSYCTGDMYVENMYFDCQMTSVDQRCFGGYNTNIGTLFLGENIETIPDKAFCREPGTSSTVKVSSVHFPISLKVIGSQAFAGSGLLSCNFNELENLESIGLENYYSYQYKVFGACSPDIIRIPSKIKIFPLLSFIFKEGQHIYVGESTTALSGPTTKYGAFSVSGNGITFHMSSSTPPAITTNWFQYAKWFEGATLYVPKGSKETYQNSGWNSCTIIEVNPVESVTLSEHSITLNKSEQFNLSATILPEDADDKSFEWKSEDESVATVDESGVVTAVKEGETKIYVTSTATGIQDFCTVLVRKNVENISLEESQISLVNIGDTKQLVAVITPNDATDKSVIWKSFNEKVCTVSEEGLVTATGLGGTIVTVTTKDGGKSDYCTVEVGGDGIMEIQRGSSDISPIYDTMGRKVKALTKGQLYITNGKKFICR